MSTPPRVFWQPEERSGLVTFHESWVADFTGETAVFASQEEAVSFCVRRWRREPIITRDAPPSDGDLHA